MSLPHFLRALWQPHYAYRPLQLLKRIRREWFVSPNSLQTVALPWNHPLQIDPTEHIGRSVWLHGIYDTVVCEILWRLSKPGMNAVDVGANVGVMTSLLAQRTGPRGRVYAFEPSPELYALLTQNVRRFRTRSEAALVPLPFALSDRDGTVQLTCPATFRENRGLASVAGPKSSRTGITVPCTRLDALFPTTHINILKIDVEGHEPNVLHGAESLLADGRIDHLLYECHDGPGARLHRKLQEHGYATFGMEETMCGPRLLPFSDRPFPPDASASFLASQYPEHTARAIAPNGWRCLSGS